MVKLELNGVELTYEQWKFPGGEIGVKVPLPIDFSGYYKVSILGLVQAEDLIVALNLCDAFGIVDELYIPYFPYARQDRVCHEEESINTELQVVFRDGVLYREDSLSDIRSRVNSLLG